MSKVKASDMEASLATSEADLPSKRARTTAHDHSAVDASASASADKLSTECLLCKVQDPAYQVPHDHTLLNVLSRLPFVDDMTATRALLKHVLLKIVLSLLVMLNQDGQTSYLMLRSDLTAYYEHVRGEVEKLKDLEFRNLLPMLKVLNAWLYDNDSVDSTFIIHLNEALARKADTLVTAVLDRLERSSDRVGRDRNGLDVTYVCKNYAQTPEQISDAVQEAVARCDLADIEAKIPTSPDRFATRTNGTAHLDGQHVRQALHTSLCICEYVSHFARMYYGSVVSPTRFVQALAGKCDNMLQSARSSTFDGSANTKVSQYEPDNHYSNLGIKDLLTLHERALAQVDTASKRFTYAMNVLRCAFAVYRQGSFPPLVHASFKNLLDFYFAPFARTYMGQHSSDHLTFFMMNELQLMMFCFVQGELATSEYLQISAYLQ